MKKKLELFDILNISFIIFLTLLSLYPLWYILVISFSTFNQYYSDPYHILPLNLTFQNYFDILSGAGRDINRSYMVSAEVTFIGTIFSMILTCMAGYVLSKRHLPGINLIYKLVIFTMYFSGGLVPLYLLVSALGLKNTILALIFPMALNTFNVILAVNYFKAIPVSLEESAKLDGANEAMILFRIIVPVSKPILAALTLFYAVDYWNNYILSVYFINDIKLFPIQMTIRSLINGYKFSVSMGRGDASGAAVNIEGVIMAAVVLSLVPIIAIYPFLQKYFIKGIMLGSVKE